MMKDEVSASSFLLYIQLEDYPENGLAQAGLNMLESLDDKTK